MTLEEAKSQLLEIKKYNENFKKTFERRPGIVSTIKLKQIKKDNKALETAIKTIEALDKIIEEIEENNPDDYFSNKPIIITKKTVIGIIEKYKKEIEE